MGWGKWKALIPPNRTWIYGKKKEEKLAENIKNIHENLLLYSNYIRAE